LNNNNNKKAEAKPLVLAVKKYRARAVKESRLWAENSLFFAIARLFTFCSRAFIEAFSMTVLPCKYVAAVLWQPITLPRAHHHIFMAKP
jgi:hypothetical protein